VSTASSSASYTFKNIEWCISVSAAACSLLSSSVSTVVPPFILFVDHSPLLIFCPCPFNVSGEMFRHCLYGESSTIRTACFSSPLSMSALLGIQPRRANNELILVGFSVRTRCVLPGLQGVARGEIRMVVLT
jgi:hypothetical protein